MALDPGGSGGGAGGEFQSPALEQLVRSLQQLPGLGRKSATRIALHLLADRDHAGRLTAAVAEALARVAHCSRCGAITETDPCRICTSPSREAAVLCVVASPVDILPFEKAAFFRGRYFVLGGLLSPLDGVRAESVADELGMSVNSLYQARFRAHAALRKCMENAEPAAGD